MAGMNAGRTVAAEAALVAVRATRDSMAAEPECNGLYSVQRRLQFKNT